MTFNLMTPLSDQIMDHLKSTNEPGANETNASLDIVFTSSYNAYIHTHLLTCDL